MTSEEREKAVNALKMSVPIYAMPQEEFNDYIQTLNKIMDWLEKEPTTENDSAHNLCDSCTNIGCEFQSGIVRTECAFYMPPHIEPDNCGNYVVQEPTTKNKLAVEKTDMIDKSNFSQEQYKSDLQSAYDCGYAQAKNDVGADCVSRILVQSAISKSIEYKENPYQLYKRIERLPSVTPQEPRKGHWIITKGGSYLGIRNGCCSNCKDFYTNDWNMMNFCPNCGADMREVEE